MKKIITSLYLFLIVLSVFGQTLDGYKYVFIQTLKYEDGRTDIWNVSSILRNYFSNKGFIVLTESSSKSKELEQDPCLLLRCFINHTNVGYGANDVTIILKNCKSEIVHSNTGSATGWSLKDDYNKATKRAFSKINDMSYNFNSYNTPQFEFPEVEKTNETEETIKEYLSSNKIDILEGIYKSYQTTGMPYYKIGIMKKDGKYKAIIIESDFKHWKPGEVKAIFEPSSMKGFYSVKWYKGNKTPEETFMNMDNESFLNIELNDQNTGEKRQDKFIKMFPITSNNATFKKNNSKASGSGFFITTDGILATNAHVIEGATTIEIIISTELLTLNYKAKVLLIDNTNDVALLQIEDERFKELAKIPFSIIEKSEVGEKVFTIGYPLNDVMGSNYKVTDGIISSKSGIADDVRYYQISVPLQPGNSGGPLFNKDGNIIGLTSARLNGQAIGMNVENVNYAIKSSYLLNLYNMLPNHSKLSNTTTLPTKELQEQIKILKDYVCLIRIF
jgi:S1-C subfamily serine protease